MSTGDPEAEGTPGSEGNEATEGSKGPDDSASAQPPPPEGGQPGRPGRGLTWAKRTEFAGAVYGSLLAASVVVGSTSEGAPPPALELVALLIGTGVAFWIVHVYAELVSHGIPAGGLDWAEMHMIAKLQWPLAQASIAPATAAILVSAFGGSDTLAAWAALIVAVVSQVSWGMVAARRTAATTKVVALSGLVNLGLGLAIIFLKTTLAD